MMTKNLIKILRKIKNTLVFIRFVAPWRPDTFFFAKVFYKISLLLNYKEFKLRKQIAKNKNSENIINPNSGILKIKLTSLKNYLHFKEDIDDLKNDFYKVDWDYVAKHH
jgi:hypothetical protein